MPAEMLAGLGLEEVAARRGARVLQTGEVFWAVNLPLTSAYSTAAVF